MGQLATKSVAWRVSTLVALAAFGSPAHAQDAAPAIRAEALFREAKELMAEQRYDAACPKLEESQRLDPGGGTLLTLALCHEQQGKTATAWGEFHESLASAAREQRPDRSRVAQAHITALEPTLSKLTVALNEKLRALPGIVVIQDGVELRAAAWGVAVPADPGTHHVEVRATGKRTFSRDVELAASGASVTVAIDALEDETAPPVPARTPESKPVRRATGTPRAVRAARAREVGQHTDSLTTAGWISGGVGVLAVGVGSYFGVRALSESHAANEKCPSSACNDSEGLRLDDEAAHAADAATVSFVVGAAALAFAGYALLIHDSDAPALNRPGVAGRRPVLGVRF